MHSIRSSTVRSKYSPLKENYVEPSHSNVIKTFNICLFLTFLILCACIVITCTIVYGNANLKIPPKSDIPTFLANRGQILEKYFTTIDNNLSVPGAVTPQDTSDDEEIVQSPSKLGSFIYSKDSSVATSNVNESNFRLVCYFGANGTEAQLLRVTDVNPHLCTHINVGAFDVKNNIVVVTDTIRSALVDVQSLKQKNPELKILLWVGAAFTGDFSEMVHTHNTRKQFIRSIMALLEEFGLDGVDLDWEFPNGMSKDRIHFCQLLHEIRREYQRKHRTYLLSLAVAAPSILVDLTYDVREINDNVDFVNIMTYDFHFYSKQTPWTGLNSPLYKRHTEGSMWAMMNINYSVNYWEQRGLARNKITVGLATYGHSFKLVNPFNTKIGAPAEGVGRVGKNGFASYSDVNWFLKFNLFVTVVYNTETCSPYAYTGTEWISFENEQSMECKTKYIKSNNFGGVMIFSLNTDNPYGFPLVKKVNSVLFS